MTKDQAIMYLRSMQGICSPQDRMAKEAVRMATDALSADAVQVVRCKDCRHRDLFSCPLADNDFQKDEDFCSWGEKRKEREEEE